MQASGEFSQLLDHLRTIYSDASSSPAVLDARPQHLFEQHRLQGAASIPLLHLRKRCFLLPDKSVPLVVINPSPAHYSVVLDPQQHGCVQPDGSAAVHLAEVHSLKEFLDTRRWTVAHVLDDTPSLWEAARQLELLEGALPSAALGRRFLFKPAPLLEAMIPCIEQILPAPVACIQRLDSSSSHQPAWRALDLGCGSGRDAVWLACRRQPAAGVNEQPGPVVPAQLNLQSPPVLTPHIQQQAPAAAQGGQCVSTPGMGSSPPAAFSPTSRCSAGGANSPGDAGVTHIGSAQQQQTQQVLYAPAAHQLPAQQLSHTDNQHYQQQQLQLPVWQVTGLDEWHGALLRGQQLAALAALSPGACCWLLARADPAAGRLVELPLPPGSPLEQQVRPGCCQVVPPGSCVHDGDSSKGGAGGGGVVAAAGTEELGAAGGAPGAATAGTSLSCGGPESPFGQATEAAAASSSGALPAGSAETGAASCSSAHGLVQPCSLDLVLCVRFLERPLLPMLPGLLRPGGVILYCTFVEGPGLAAYGRPSGPDRVLSPGELARDWFGERQGFKVLRDDVALSDDGRELTMFAAQKL